MSDYHITCVSQALSPVSHGAGVSGNEQVIMREPVAYRDGVRYIPCITGNAIRHRFIREPLARHLCEAWELGGSLTVDELQFLFHGGALTERGSRVSMQEQADLFRLMPCMRLLGCSLPGQIVPGSLDVMRGTLVCAENADRLRQLLPDDLAGELPQRLRPAADFIGRYQYTRGSHLQSAADMGASELGGEDSGMMIFSGQHVIPGAVFVHGFVLRHASALDIGAVALAIRKWRDAGGSIGGMASKGHGRLELLCRSDIDIDIEEAEREYAEYVRAVKDDGVTFLHSLFLKKSSRKAKR